jgi:alpha-L-fucosidase 2
MVTMKFPPVFLAAAFAAALALPAHAQITSAAEGPGGRYVLWYKQPAANWYEALPVGNGLIGAMVFGDPHTEHVQFNEGTLWSGGPYQPSQPGGPEAVEQARKLVFQNTPASIGQANSILLQKVFGRPIQECSYLPFGDIAISFPKFDGVPITNYCRSLNLETATATTTFQAGGVTYTREVLASYPDHVLAIRLSADEPNMITCTAKFATPLPDARQAADGKILTLTAHNIDYTPQERGLPVQDAKVKGALTAHARIETQHEGGIIQVSDDGISVQEADAVTFVMSAATNYVNFRDVSGDPVAKAKATLEAAGPHFEIIRAAHLIDYQALFKRVSIDLGHSEASKLPTNERVAHFAGGGDPDLAALLFEYGRYLLIESSRSGGQPANLQGIWNGQNPGSGALDVTPGMHPGSPMQPAWGSKYTTNINTEMNYWPAETANLTECTGPLFSMIHDLSISGAETAKTTYGAHGWVLHHNTDLWRGTAPVDFPATGMWTTGGAWLCTHLWEHYLFTQNKKFLAAAYPLMKGAAEFFEDYLVEDPNYPDKHWLVTNPAYSPENGELCAGPTMDNALLRDLFGQTAAAARVLGVDADFQNKLLSLRAQLPPFQIGKWGQFQEWLEDKDNPGDNNRHVSQLYALFPSHQVSQRETPDLFNAAKVTLKGRGDAGTGWSLAWKINFWARLLDGDHAYLILSNLLNVPGSHGRTFDTGGGTYPNLLDAHPPFQIDGNFGATSGIAEMLLQSQMPEAVYGVPLLPGVAVGGVQRPIGAQIALLPALPSAWPTGSVQGLRARGGFEVSEAWQDGKLTKATIRNINGDGCTVRYGEKSVSLHLAPGAEQVLDGELQAVR